MAPQGVLHALRNPTEGFKIEKLMRRHGCSFQEGHFLRKPSAMLAAHNIYDSLNLPGSELGMLLRLAVAHNVSSLNKSIIHVCDMCIYHIKYDHLNHIKYVHFMLFHLSIQLCELAAREPPGPAMLQRQETNLGQWLGRQAISAISNCCK